MATGLRRTSSDRRDLGPRLIRAMIAVAVATFATVASMSPAASASAADHTDPVVVEVYWGEGCGFCEQLLDHLDGLSTRQSGFTVEAYEVWFDRDNARRLAERATALGVRADAVPFTIIGSDHWIGFSNAIGRQIDTAIARAVAVRSPSTPVGPAPVGPAPGVGPGADDTIVDVPLLGEVDVTGRSLVLSTALIAFVDGFNPCSLWVLTVLLALVLHTGSRRRVALIGGSFLLVTTVVYGLFIIGVYSALSFVSALTWIRAAVATFALVFGIVNVKDFLWFKKGPSFTIADKHKPGIAAKARNLIRPGTALPAAMAGAAAMAVGVSLLEIPCTAGFPIIWSDLVNAAGVSNLGFIALWLLYLVIYLFDELVVFGVAVATMRVTKLQERHGRFLKLVGGMVMITIGVTILLAPHAMDTPTGVLAVFAIALVASALIAWAERAVRGPGAPPPAGPARRAHLTEPVGAAPPRSGGAATDPRGPRHARRPPG